jgi:2'-5' RNA ligase
MTGEKALRLFVAVELPESWLAALGELQGRMREALAADELLAAVRLRWVRPEAIHLTLKFIGEISPDSLASIREQLAHAVPRQPEVTIHAGGIGSFEDRRAPRVIWAGVRDEPPQSLRVLADSIETWLAAAGIPRERRGFRAHLTLARLPEGLTDEQRRRAAQVTTSVEAPILTPFTVESVNLIQSFLGPGGARYERLGRWPG